MTEDYKRHPINKLLSNKSDIQNGICRNISRRNNLIHQSILKEKEKVKAIQHKIFKLNQQRPSIEQMEMVKDSKPIINSIKKKQKERSLIDLQNILSFLYNSKVMDKLNKECLSKESIEKILFSLSYFTIYKEVDCSDYVFYQGDDPEYFYIIIDGKASVLCDEVYSVKLSLEEYFLHVKQIKNDHDMNLLYRTVKLNLSTCPIRTKHLDYIHIITDMLILKKGLFLKISKLTFENMERTIEYFRELSKFVKYFSFEKTLSYLDNVYMDILANMNFLNIMTISVDKHIDVLENILLEETREVKINVKDSEKDYKEYIKNERNSKNILNSQVEVKIEVNDSYIEYINIDEFDYFISNFNQVFLFTLIRRKHLNCLYKGFCFGDIGIENKLLKRSASIRALDGKLALSLIPSYIYNEYISNESTKQKTKYVSILYENFVFSSLPKQTFVQKYFPFFLINRLKKGEFLYKKGRRIEKISLLIKGSVKKTFKSSTYELIQLYNKILSVSVIEKKKEVKGRLLKSSHNYENLFEHKIDKSNQDSKQAKKIQFNLNIISNYSILGLEEMYVKSTDWLFDYQVESDLIEVLQIDLKNFKEILKEELVWIDFQKVRWETIKIVMERMVVLLDLLVLNEKSKAEYGLKLNLIREKEERLDFQNRKFNSGDAFKHKNISYVYDVNENFQSLHKSKEYNPKENIECLVNNNKKSKLNQLENSNNTHSYQAKSDIHLKIYKKIKNFFLPMQKIKLKNENIYHLTEVNSTYTQTEENTFTYPFINTTNNENVDNYNCKKEKNYLKIRNESKKWLNDKGFDVFHGNGALNLKLYNMISMTMKSNRRVEYIKNLSKGV